MAKSKDYKLTTWADGFDRWHAKAEFTYPGLGNTGEAERVLFNARRGAFWAIKRQVFLREGEKKWRLALEVVENNEAATGQLLSITWAEK